MYHQDPRNVENVMSTDRRSLVTPSANHYLQSTGQNSVRSLTIRIC